MRIHIGDSFKSVKISVWTQTVKKVPSSFASLVFIQPRARETRTMSQWNSDFCFPSNGQILYSICCPHCSMASARNNFDTSNWCFNCLCVSGPVAYNIVREGYGIEVCPPTRSSPSLLLSYYTNALAETNW
jgi:hypothetical protein